MLTIDRTLQTLASRTSRRSLLARVGSGLIAASVLVFAQTKNAAASCWTCGRCGTEPCASTNGACCPGCLPCGGWCTGVTGGACPSFLEYGWYWYCCNSGDLLICQDCCYYDPDLQDYACYCTSKGYLGFC